jgi:enamine deaminase RidA (YjgF/YER057c/UK114 family)
MSSKNDSSHGAMTKPFADYPHVKKCGAFYYLAGQGCRDPLTNTYPGTVLEEDQVVSYDMEAQSQGVFSNIERALQSVQLDRRHLVDIQVFLTNMDDFPKMNQVWNAFFSETNAPTRTTICVAKLPGHNQVEMKAIAYKEDHP